MTIALAGTAQGLFRLPVEALGRADAPDPHPVAGLEGSPITALAAGPDGWLALVDGRAVWRCDPEGRWAEVAAFGDGHAGTCLSAAPGGALVGTRRAHLLRVDGGTAAPVPGFDTAEGRDGWYTPWGGPPDTRSLSVAPEGVLYANVHVGGIVRSLDGGATWHPTIDVDTDVHQVVVHKAAVLAATAYGLAVSGDRGDTWSMQTDGLHATYLRAVTASGDAVMVSASTGPDGSRSAIYRRPAGGGPFERSSQGLPEWLGENVDTRCLAMSGATALFGTADGTVHGSTDAGSAWDIVAEGLPRVTAVAIGP